jgi:L-aspartate oxidase
MSLPHRYLVSFGPKQTPHLFTDLLVIGAGIAGLRAALEVPPDLDVLVVTKDSLQQSNSAFAQGGIAGVLAPEDRFENHIEDTLVAGAGLCDRAVVEMVVRDAPEQIHKLIDWGTHFDEEGGKIALTREGGHSHRRIVHALGDATGHEVMRAVIDRARQAANVTLWDNTFTIDLLTHDGRCVGALVSRPFPSPPPPPSPTEGRGGSQSSSLPLSPLWERGLGGEGLLLIWAKQTILASGGCGMVYRETTNPPVATGDGMAIAYRAGAELRDMEFMQFHPTVLYVAGSARYLISEAVRGEGAYLRDKNGVRFMPAEDPRGELAPRDVVAQAIFRCMDRTQHPNVYLDLSHLDPALVRQRFPGIARVCAGFGLDITKDMIPVRPGAHYMIGGVTVDQQGRTTLPGLWAAGEVTSSGLHGANRLASNSLLEGLVYGTLCAHGAAVEAARMPDLFTVPPVRCRLEPGSDTFLDVADVTNSLRSLMVRKMGIVRDRAGLVEAERAANFWCRYALAREFRGRGGWELQNLLTVARLMIGSALRREESRGVHFRGDFPERDDGRWLKQLTCPPLG